MLEFVQAHWDTMVEILVLIVGLAVVVTKLTPSTTDDEWALKVKEFVEEALKKKAP
jgi:hypothetical protein